MKGVEKSVVLGNMGIENFKKLQVFNFKGIFVKMMDFVVGVFI